MTRQINFPGTEEFGFTIHDSSGSATDAADVRVHVRKHGTANNAAPMYSVSAELLSHADYPTGQYYVPIAATTANGFSADFTYTAYARGSVAGALVTNIVAEFKTEALVSADGLSSIIDGALTNYGAVTSAVVSAVVETALGNHPVLTSAIASTIVSQNFQDRGISSAGGQLAATLSELTSAPNWADMNLNKAITWIMMRSLNKHVQGTAKLEIYTSANTVMTSASVGDDGSEATREQFLA